MELFDTHCHLDILSEENKFNQEIKNSLTQEFTDAGLTHLTQIAVDYNSSKLNLMLCSNNETPDLNGLNTLNILRNLNIAKNFNLFFTMGMHPGSGEFFSQTDDLIKFIRLNNQHTSFVAIGEIGLDFYRDYNKEDQLRIFRIMLDLAEQLNQPVVIHCRDAFAETYNEVKDRNVSGIIHCFTGNEYWAGKFAELGFFISFSGIVTFKNAVDIRQAAKSLPVNKIIVETDSPYLAPVPKRGRVNIPAYVKYTLEFIADLRGDNKNYLAEVIMANSKKVFNIKE